MRTWITDIAEQQRRIEEMQQYQQSAVQQARLAGHSWSEIGAALAISKQAAQQRYPEKPASLFKEPTA